MPSENCEFGAVVDSHAACVKCGRRVLVRAAGAIRGGKCGALALDEHASREIRRDACRFLGAQVGMASCTTCPGNTRLKVYRCSHPRHEHVTLGDCRSCGDRQSIETLPRVRTMLVRFWHGLGDHVQLGVVLRHLRAIYPTLAIDVATPHVARAAGLIEAGLCRAIVPWAEASDAGYDVTRSLYFNDPETCYAGSPATKAERALVEVFRIAPRTELCGYSLGWSREASDATGQFCREVGPFALIHFTGHCLRPFKDLPEFAVRTLVRALAKRGVGPVILDLDGRRPLVDERDVVRIDGGHALFGGAPDASKVAALANSAALCVGIDSGPGKIFSATRAPTLIVWTGMHPLHYHSPGGNTLHSVPVSHARLLMTSPETGLEYFTREYRYATRRRCLSDELPDLAIEILDRGIPTVSR